MAIQNNTVSGSVFGSQVISDLTQYVVQTYMIVKPAEIEQAELKLSQERWDNHRVDMWLTCFAYLNIML